MKVKLLGYIKHWVKDRLSGSDLDSDWRKKAPALAKSALGKLTDEEAQALYALSIWHQMTT